MKNVILKFLVLILVSASVETYAGTYQSNGMFTDPGWWQSYAIVPLNDSRDTGFPTSSGGCKLHLVLSSNTTYLWCQAYRNQFNQINCHLVNPEPATLYAVLALNKTSSLRFKTNDTGRCFDITVENNSWHLNR